MTVTTALPYADALALADQHLAAWLKREGCEEPPPALLGPPPALSTAPPTPSDPCELSAPSRAGAAAPYAERFRLGDRVLLDRDGGPLPGPGGPSGPGDPSGPGSPSGPGGRYDRRRVRTPAPHGTDHLTLTLAAGPVGPTWLRLEAATRITDSAVRTPGRVPVPEPARTLLPLLDAADGPAAVLAAPRMLTATEVDGLVDELCDPDRRMPAVVASVPAGLDAGAWLADVVAPLCEHLPGLATLYVLDAEARTRFNVALEFHAVYGGAVRTYLPEVDPASRRDGRRHPVLARHRIEEDPRRAAVLLSREPRRLAAERTPPATLAAVPPLRVPASVPVLAAPVAVPAGRPAGTEEPERGARSAHSPYPAHSAHPVRHEGRREHRRERSKPKALTAGGPGAGRGSLGRLCTAPAGAAPAPPTLFVPAPAAPPRLLLPAPARRAGRRRTGPAGGRGGIPLTFAELMDRLGEFPLLTFTGDQKAALALDELRCAGGGWARLTWDGLTALQEYAEAAVRGRAGGDFKQWCERTPADCHRFPPRKAVRGESRTVYSHAKWKRERMLPVPECVDASRRAFMGAHLRIGGGRTAPRLHYLDDCSGSGRIYVGYIGLHLTNTRTN
ncbi:hypothetical protein OG401_27270 [Kitasatospora purpeofusca]|uniref:hypothetical protein n=1 Tax=Kitasatospora purpeofusca TaxID=67352 RepID=UPI00225306EB|nr:hypothetical protein [Kitasatospora purpeofusca]MCX4687956.1 hypothetical protein [Kitasatospora purpeofusca]